MDGLGEIIPGAHSFVAVMEYAFHPLVRLQDPVYGFGQIKSVGWGTYLVGHDFKCALFAPEPSHGLDEVFAIGGVEPSGAYDDAVGGECREGRFRRCAS